jgi:hypothetical protein
MQEGQTTRSALRRFTKVGAFQGINVGGHTTGELAVETWPFADPPNVAVFTVRAVTEQVPILEVSHDLDDGAWQFLTGSPVHMSEALLISLEEIFEIDPSLAELADLPIGWQASRDRIGAPWQRIQIGTDD